MDHKITLELVKDEEMAEFKRRMQVSFTEGAKEAFPDFGEVIPPESDIDESLGKKGAEALQILRDGQPVGGAVITGSGVGRFLDFLFIDPEFQNLHLGAAAWNAIEARYPEVAVWELITPYHEKRNIHFYVNTCGFSIVEYFNERHPDPNYPQEEAGSYPGAENGLFRFRKVTG